MRYGACKIFIHYFCATHCLAHVSMSQATESITKVATVLLSAQVEEFYIPLLKQLSHGEWSTSHVF